MITEKAIDTSFIIPVASFVETFFSNFLPLAF